MRFFRVKDDKVNKLGQALAEETRDKSRDFEFAVHDHSKAERAGYSDYSYWKSTLRAFAKNKAAMVCFVLMCATLLFTFLEPLLPYAKEANTIYRLENGLVASNLAPSGEYWFGTNVIGQDLWSQIWSGTRTSLGIGFAVAAVDAMLGVIIGVLWGYVRKLDFFFTELYNVFDNVPQTLVVIIISYIMRPGVGTMIFAMCLTSWLQTARFVRNQVVIIRDRDYNLASRCLGTSPGKIMVKNLLPYLVSIITLRIALAIPAAIGNEVFITYIGLGVPLETPSLGNLIEAGRKVMMEPSMRYQLFFPVGVLAIITISFYVIGNAFADAADPKNHTV